MIGKILKVNDYKFMYGKETIYVDAFGAFKNKKSGNKYIIYSYDTKKLFYGTLFVREEEAVVMSSKDDISHLINCFINLILTNGKNDDYEIISLDKMNAIEIIEEKEYTDQVDINKLKELTIPKPIIEEKKETKEKNKDKKNPIVIVGIILVILLIGLFFLLNPEVIKGKNKLYACNKSYSHDELPAEVNETVNLTFNGKNKIINIDIVSDYVFTDTNYYTEFKNKSYFYKYFEEGDTYKFDDSNYTYRLFSKIDPENDYFMPSNLDELVKYYQENKYTCTIKEKED